MLTLFFKLKKYIIYLNLSFVNLIITIKILLLKVNIIINL